MSVDLKQFAVLKEYHFFDDSSFDERRFNRSYNISLLAVYGRGDVEKLVTIKKIDVTKQNRIMSLIGLGPLANTYYSLQDLRDYLLQFNWQVIGRTINRTVFKNVRKIAARLVVYKKDDALWNKVSCQTRTDNGVFGLNPECTGRVFRALVALKLSRESAENEMPKFEILPKEGSQVFLGATLMRNACEVNLWEVKRSP